MFAPQPKKRASVTVRTDWFGLWPRRGRHLRFWGAVGRRVKERGVRHNEHGTIRLICREVENEFRRKGM